MYSWTSRTSHRFGMFGNLYDVGAEYETHREVVTLRDAPSEDDENDGITSRETTSVAPQFSRRCFASSAPAGPPPLPGAKVEAGQLRSLYPSMNPNAMGARPDH